MVKFALIYKVLVDLQKNYFYLKYNNNEMYDNVCN